MPEEKKQKLKEYQKIIARQKGLKIVMNKNSFLIMILIAYAVI